MIKGENHYNYKGGFAKMSNFIRAKLKPWKNMIFDIYGNICPISGDKDDLVVHHLTSFNKIFNNVINSYAQYKDMCISDVCINDFESE